MKTAHATIALALTVSLAACGVGDDQAALVASAKAYVAKREYMAATIQAKNALQKDPDNREARYLLGLASLEIGDVLSAEQHLKKAIELGHTADEVQVAFARTLLAKGDSAMQSFRRRKRRPICWRSWVPPSFEATGVQRRRRHSSRRLRSMRQTLLPILASPGWLAPSRTGNAVPRRSRRRLRLRRKTPRR
jgi:Tfp pilus assembly protein PilF